MNLLLLGKPGAGKGSVAEVIKKNTNIIHLSTGDIFRKEMKEETELGLLAKSYINKGQLVPDEVTNEIIKSVLKKNPNNSYLFDGYPRTVNQAIFLKGAMKELGMKLDGVFDLETDDDLVIERLSSRRVCKACGAIYNTRNHNPKVEGVCDVCGGEIIQRKDDKAEAIKERLVVYETQTKPLIDYYQAEGLLYKLDSSKESIYVYNDIMGIIDAK
ncbi:MAG: adenylate kinase [Gammaproteobacteria bacterium]|nr:adenylate kinase [Gammaproteobacteria bacterium]